MTSSNAPGDVLDENLARRIEEFGLRSNVEQLSREGYTIIHDPRALEIADTLRAAIIRDTPPPTEHGVNSAVNLLDKDDVYVKAVSVPQLMVLIEYLLGRGAVLSQVSSSRVKKSSYAIQLHADNGWFPAPFPKWEMTCTACFVTDSYSLQEGATLMMPGTHVHKRQPSKQEAEAREGAIPLTAPKGSICLWDGSVWHANYPRQIDGERVVLHTTYNRLGIAPIENYDHLDDRWLEGKEASISSLLGRSNFLGRRAGWKEDHAKLFADTYAQVYGKEFN